MKVTQRMLDYCRNLGNGVIEPSYLGAGLCTNFHILFNNWVEKYIDFSDYPNFSGDIEYPLKSRNKTKAPHEYYGAHENLWVHKRGEERRKFCLWCADELEKML